MKKTAFFLIAIAVTAQIPLRAEMPETAASEEAVLTQVRELQALKAENPEVYRQLIERKKAYLREALQRRGPENGLRFREFVQKRQEFRQRRLQYFQQKHPEEFRQFSETRRERFLRFQTEKPEAFRQFAERHPRLRERRAYRSGEPQQRQRMQRRRPSRRRAR